MNQPLREGFVDPQAKPAAQAAPAALPAPAAPPVVDMTGAPVQQAAPAAPVSEWPITIKLRKRPITGNRGEVLNELTFREPTARDIMNCGNPVWITATGEVQFDERKMTAVMAHLSGVLQPLLDSMHPTDWNSCAYRLRRFFLPDPEAW
jgi:hypothetical protein